MRPLTIELDEQTFRDAQEPTARRGLTVADLIAETLRRLTGPARDHVDPARPRL